MKLSETELAEWFRDPCTQHLMGQLREKIEEAKTNWSFQTFISDDQVQSDRRNIQALSEVQTLRLVLAMIEAAEQKQEA